MTENRMYLICKTDHEFFCIGKYHTASSWRPPTKDFLKNYEKFLEDHTHAYDEYGQDFDFVYEKDPSEAKTPTQTEEIFYSRKVSIYQNKEAWPRKRN